MQPTRVCGRHGRRNVVFLARFFDAFIRKGVIKSFGVLVPAMTVYLNTDYTRIGLILSLNASLTQLSCLIMNPLMKRVNTRVIAAVGGLVTGICVLGTAFAPSIFMLGFLLVIAGLFSAACNLGTATMLQKHYGKKFGSVNSLALMGISAGSTLLPLLTAEIYEQFGLRGTLLILGALLLNEFPIGCVLISPRRQRTRRSVIDEGMLVGPQIQNTPCRPQNSNMDIPEGEELPTYSGSSEKISCADTELPIAFTGGHISIQYCEILAKDRKCDVRDGKVNHERAVQEKTSSAGCCCMECLAGLRDIFDFRIFREEKHFSIFMVPILILSAITNYGWVLFVISYAISVGINSFQATFLAAGGAIGGMFSCAVQAIVFHKRPDWSPHLMAAMALSGSVALFLQPLHSSLTYLLLCSFVVGGSLYGMSTVVDAVVAVIVAPENFQAAIAFTFALEGIGTLIAGPLSGFLFDCTGSFKTVFKVLGGFSFLALVLALLLILSRCYQKKKYRAVSNQDPV